jgi:beta-glucanase (GH16 family)
MTRSNLAFLTSVAAGSALFIVACSSPPEEPMDGSGGTTPGAGNSTSTGGSTPGGGGGTGTGGGGTVGDGDGDVTPPGSPPYGHPAADTSTYPTYEGFTLWLAEEFENPIDLDQDPIWTWSDGGLTEGKVRFVKDNIKFNDGKMQLVVSQDPQAGSCSDAEIGNVFQKTHTSGEMRTRHNMFRHGRYEVRMKVPSPVAADPAVNGNYIATMFIFRTPKFQEWREIDIEVTGTGTDSVTTNLITGDGKFAWSADIQEVESYQVPGINTRTEFHDYAFEWVPDRITWYVDGKVLSERVTGSGLPIPELSAKIMMNLWVFDGSGFGGVDGANNTYPMMTEYEWFRFYKWDGDTEYPCAAMDETCLKEADKDLSSNNGCDMIDQFGEVTPGKPPSCIATCGQ